LDLTAKKRPNREQRASGVEGFFGKASELVDQPRNGTLSNLLLVASSLERAIASEEYGVMHHTVAFPSRDRVIVDRNYAGFREKLTPVKELASKWIGPL
jgi:hypothetical protein